MLSRLSCVRLFSTLWIIACLAPLSLGFSRQEYWVGLSLFSIGMYTYIYMGFLGGSDGKESTCNAEDSGSAPELGSSLGERNGYPPVFLPGEFHEQRSLEGYSSWSCKESDTTEQLAYINISICMYVYIYIYLSKVSLQYTVP